MSSRRMDSAKVLLTSEGLILIRQEIRGELDAVIALSPKGGEILAQDIRKACAEIKSRKENKGVTWQTKTRKKSKSAR